MTSMRKQQSCFVAMPFDQSYDSIYSQIRRCISSLSYQSIRVDHQTFTKSIVEKIFEEISDSKVVIFLANDKNPNAYYECGYAIALGKEVLMVTDHYSNLPFDIRDRNAISYGSDLKKLERELSRRLSNLTVYK